MITFPAIYPINENPTVVSSKSKNNFNKTKDKGTDGTNERSTIHGNFFVFLETVGYDSVILFAPWRSFLVFTHVQMNVFGESLSIMLRRDNDAWISKSFETLSN